MWDRVRKLKIWVEYIRNALGITSSFKDEGFFLANFTMTFLVSYSLQILVSCFLFLNIALSPHRLELVWETDLSRSCDSFLQDLGFQYIVSSFPSEPSSRAVRRAVIAVFGIKVPTIRLLFSSLSLTTWKRKIDRWVQIIAKICITRTRELKAMLWINISHSPVSPPCPRLESVTQGTLSLITSPKQQRSKVRALSDILPSFLAWEKNNNKISPCLILTEIYEFRAGFANLKWPKCAELKAFPA